MNLHKRRAMFAFAIIAVLLISCEEKTDKQSIDAQNLDEKSQIEFDNRGHELIYQVAQTVGDYDDLRAKRDVVYTYTYSTPDGKTDISTEKYIFDGELSYGEYKQHQRTLPHLEGVIVQAYDGNDYWIKHNGQVLNDSLALKRAAFNRPTNFYWFCMFQKLLDPGLKYEYMGEKSQGDKSYNIVKVSFESQDDRPTDIYQVYINKETGLVDQFLFTVADFGIMEEPLLMQVEYEEVDGILIPTQRKYKKSNWEARVSDAPWITVNWDNIKFDNGLTKGDFQK